MTTIVAGTKYRGEFEERMKNIVDELKQADPHVICFHRRNSHYCGSRWS